MTIVKAHHDPCGVIELSPRSITLVLAADPHYRWVCVCDDLVRKPAPPEVVALLKSAGVVPLVEVPWTDPLDEDYLIAFGRELEELR